jgi:hypothetical protein
MLLSLSVRQRPLHFLRVSPVRWLIRAAYVLATVQFAGVYYFLTQNYLDYNRYEHGYERLPFQTRLLLAPFLRWADNNERLVRYAGRISHSAFFPDGIAPQDVALFFLNIASVLVAGWVAVRLYSAASGRNLAKEFVYPIFLCLCAVTYVLHTVQNFRFVYDLPNLALFSVGLYLIYFRKPVIWFCALFVVATLNRETSLLLLPFYVISQIADDAGSLRWRRVFSSQVLAVVLPLFAYWVVWHLMIFHMFRNNASEYYSRLSVNMHTLGSLRNYPQIFSALGYLPIFLLLYRRRIHDPQLRAWMWMLPAWAGLMYVWGIIVETRIFGELIAYTACVSTILAEEVIASRLTAQEEIAGEEEYIPNQRRAA